MRTNSIKQNQVKLIQIGSTHAHLDTLVPLSETPTANKSTQNLRSRLKRTFSQDEAQTLTDAEVTDASLAVEHSEGLTAAALASEGVLYAQAQAGTDVVSDAGEAATAGGSPAMELAGLPAVGAFSLMLGLGVGAVAVAVNSSNISTPPVVTDTTAPAFTSAATASVTENTAAGTVVHKVVATDNAAVTSYAFASGGADNDKFTLDSSTGELKFKASPDFEALGSAAGNNAYSVKVQATDAAGNTTVQAVTINVTDVIETLPDGTPPDITSPTTANVAENTAIDTVVHQVVATDNVAVASYTFASGGADNDKFTLDASTGEIKFKASPDFEASGSAAGSNAYIVKIKAVDAAGNSAIQTVTLNVSDMDEESPVFTDGVEKTINVAENTSGTIYTPSASDNMGVTGYGFGLAVDNARFNIDSRTGALSFKTAPDFEAPASALNNSNTYTLKIVAVDGAGHSVIQTVTVNVTDVADTPIAPSSSAQAFTLWQEAETAWTEQQDSGTTTHDINALNTHSMAIMQQHDTTSRDGSANQTDTAKRLTQWVDQVTGTDVVSQAEHQSGFSITGHATAGSSGTVKFYLDNDRTDGVNQVGTQLQDGVNGVHIAYNNTSGDYTLSFDANSIMLKPATHSTWGSGIHQLSVDTDGNGAMNGVEASRLFLVADGTAQTGDTGTVAQNYSVQDKITGDVFVYYFGDPDGAGVGLSTPLDNGDTNTNTGQVMTDKDTTVGGDYGDYDYYNSNVGNALPAATAANTSLHLVTNIAAQTWEFHMATQTTTGNQIETTWDQNNTLAIDHVLFDSNTSRVASFQEAIALYAANFGGNNGGEGTPGSTVAGAVQPIGNETWVNDRTPTAAEDNHPRSWDHDIWTAANLPGGHAVLDLYYANAVVFPDNFTQHGITVVM